MSLQLGSIAPNFKLKDQYNEDVSLEQFKGKKVVLSWHPLAWTPTCTDQMRALEANYQSFLDKNAIPLGFSVDPQPSKAAWAYVLRLTNLKILADFWPHGKVASDYGIFDQESGISKRACFIVDEEGKLKWNKVYATGELPDLEEIFDNL